MVNLPWSIEIVRWFMENRTPWLTDIFLFFTFLGGEMGYLVLIVGFYWLYNKRVAIQLVLATLSTVLVNHFLKILIRNPRPFVDNGTYQENWAIPEEAAKETANSFSTPSGHAQSSTTFWFYLHLKIKSRLTFLLLPIMILLIGISRVYLGVHYLEDVILGWIIGFAVIVLLNHYDQDVEDWWSSISKPIKYLLVIPVPLFIVILGGITFNFEPSSTMFGTLGGFFTGLTLGYMLDKQFLRFDPDLTYLESRSKQIGVGLARYILGLFLVGLVLFGLDELFALIAPDLTLLGLFLRWIRYSLVGLIAMVVVPYLFKQLKLTKGTE